MNRLILFLLISFSANAQNTIGLPDIINYSKQSYGAGLQNWDIKQDKSKIVYIANNEGLLSYDGKYWNLYPLPNKTVVRSVAPGENNTIYAGGQDELGYFSPAANGSLQYHSLAGLLLEKDKNFGDVWDIAILNGEVFFRTNQKIFRFTNQSVAMYEAPQEWSYMNVSGGQLYAHDSKNGIMKFNNNVWKPLYEGKNLQMTNPVTAILSINKDSILITTLKDGIYIGSNTGLAKVTSVTYSLAEKERIYAATLITTDRIALATSSAGIYITDLKGQLIQRFTTKEGLQDKNVLSIFLDEESNLWLGLNNGIDFISYNSAIKQIKPDVFGGSGYSILVHQNILYTGTSAGVASVALQPEKDFSFSKGSFNAVAGTAGQVWNLSDVNGQLLAGIHEGAFTIKHNQAIPITNNTGYWNFVPETPVYPTPRIIGGNYLGINFFNYNNGSFSLGTSIPGFNETSRYLAIDKYNNIWVSHPYHGLFKIESTSNGQYKVWPYTNKQGLPSTLNNHIFKIRNEIAVATERGVYQFNSKSNSFEPAAFYKNILGDQSIRYLKEDAEGNIWFIHEKKLGVIEVKGDKKTIFYIPELNNKMLSGFEFIYPYNSSNIFMGGENGFYLINYEKYRKNVPQLQVDLRRVIISDTKDSVIYGGYTPATEIKSPPKKINISKNWKTILFEFTSPLFGQQASLEYSYRLKGYTNDWSDWSNKTEKEFSNLRAGSYTFEVKVRNNLGNESDQTTFDFKILPPWYMTIWAYLLYFLLAGICIYAIVKWQQKKFASQEEKYGDEQKKQQYLHQLEMEKADKELIAVRNAKLQAEIDFKNTELATSAMHLLQKSELITGMKNDLNLIAKEVENNDAANELKKLVKTLGADEKMDKDWEHFAQHFDKVHNDFVEKLKEKHPNVTGNEIKLCAYLRMNLSTKEIAQLMNISVRGVEISRYRLRKKLNLNTEDNLFTYMINI